ncbi:MAG: hypothetical protein FJW88_11250 [Actinobacteria bacterium]|nr:hypothetical protein [Actinomycetota bacterium]
MRVVVSVAEDAVGRVGLLEPGWHVAPVLFDPASVGARAVRKVADLLARVEREVTPLRAFVGQFGSVKVAHTGPGLVGLAWWWDDAADGR